MFLQEAQNEGQKDDKKKEADEENLDPNVSGLTTFIFSFTSEIEYSFTIIN